jgi:hypothetical protein
MSNTTETSTVKMKNKNSHVGEPEKAYDKAYYRPPFRHSNEHQEKEYWAAGSSRIT